MDLMMQGEGEEEEEVEEEMGTMRKRTSLVNFDINMPDKTHVSISRDPTPFPKELHAKAMQWRAAREAALGGGGVAKLEGGVVKRAQSAARRTQNRNSLLTALSNPLDVSEL